MSWSFCPMQASTPRATGRCRGRRSIPFRCSSLSCRRASRSPTSSKRAGKCNRKPALPVECQGSHLLFCKQHVFSKIHLNRAETPGMPFLYNRYRDQPAEVPLIVPLSKQLSQIYNHNLLSRGVSFLLSLILSHATFA